MSPRSHRLGGRLVLVGLLGTLALAAAGCSGGGSAEPSTADFEGTVADLDRVHVAVSDVISGEAGCANSTLAPTAISFDASGLDQPNPVRIHLYRFRDGSTYDRLRPDVDQCARSFVTNPDDYVALDARPLVATSIGPWGPQFTAAVRSALERAAAGP
ncbi:MAG TPA: hypothetical protein VGK63_07280 [Candidatus Limnocylindrales bacterium]